MKPVMSLGDWPTNAHMIADVAKLGYLDGRVLDLTYGLGRFWTQHRPAHLITNDPERPADHHVDATNLSDLVTEFGRDSFDSVVFDPPYKLAGTATPSTESMIDAAYGVNQYRSAATVTELLRSGVRNSSYLVKPGGHVLVKCQDQVVSGNVVWQTYGLVNWLTEYWNTPNGKHRLDLIADFKFPSYRPQPAGRSQLNARRNYSTLLVFRRNSK